MDDPSSQKNAALGGAITKVLEEHGHDLLGTPWFKPFKEGLFEFRVNKTERQVLYIVNATLGTSNEVTDSERILLRVFVHIHRSRTILLLGGYDKSVHTNKRRRASRKRRVKIRIVGLPHRSGRTPRRFV
jgi:putative component of toxin-antitoxin plasmid stabilization module